MRPPPPIRAFTFEPSPTTDPWAWWKTDALSLSDGDRVTGFADSANDYDLAHLDEGNQPPRYLTDQINGLPALGRTDVEMGDALRADFTAYAMETFAAYVVCKPPVEVRLLTASASLFGLRFYAEDGYQEAYSSDGTSNVIAWAEAAAADWAVFTITRSATALTIDLDDTQIASEAATFGSVDLTGAELIVDGTTGRLAEVKVFIPSEDGYSTVAAKYGL